MQEEFKELIRRAKKGDAQAFALLYGAVYKDLYKYAFYTLRTKEDAEDAVADTVIDCYSSIRKLKNEEAFRKWMFTVLSAKCKRIMSWYYDKSTEDSEKYVSFAQGVDEKIDLKHAMENLDTDSRMIVLLTVFGGYSSDETAKILKLNRNTVRSKYSRALDKLKILLSHENRESLHEKVESGNE